MKNDEKWDGWALLFCFTPFAFVSASCLFQFTVRFLLPHALPCFLSRVHLSVFCFCLDWLLVGVFGCVLCVCFLVFFRGREGGRQRNSVLFCFSWVLCGIKRIVIITHMETTSLNIVLAGCYSLPLDVLILLVFVSLKERCLLRQNTTCRFSG